MKKLFQRIKLYIKYKTGVAKEGIDFHTYGFCVKCAHYESCMNFGWCKNCSRYGICNRDSCEATYKYPDYTCKRFKLADGIDSFDEWKYFDNCESIPG